ncbi:MAG: DUF4234 domain-containing protein [Clostridia bacterium]|nr:DUF4234 domain-containing protein [Clostridia bacterium]
MLEKREIVSVILFSILTCGIYMLWWTYVTCTAMQQHGHKTSIPPILTVLLFLFFPVAGGALLALDADDNLNAIKETNGMQKTDNKILWLILGVLIPIVLVGLVQYEINNMIDCSQRMQFEAQNQNQNG